MSNREIDAILDRFLHENLSIEEAEAALQDLRLVRRQAIARLLVLLREVVTRDGNPDTLLILANCLGDAAIVQSLVDMVQDPAVADATKLKLISLIDQLEPDRDMSFLLNELDDPREALAHSQREHLSQLQRSRDLAIWVELMVTQMPPDMRVAFIESLDDLNEPSAVPLLTCLCYDPDDEVALAAMNAVEHFKDARALPALEELARKHPSPGVRTEALKTADRLRVRASLVPQAEPLPMAPLYRCYLTTIDGSGEQTAIISRRLSDETIELVDVTFDDQQGLKQCLGTDVQRVEFADLIESLAEDSLTPVPVTHEQCMDVLDQACELTWESGHPLPMSYIAWRRFVEGDGERGRALWADLVVPDSARDRLLHQCHELMLQDEFVYWCFAPDEIGDLPDRYLDLVKDSSQCAGQEAVRSLLRRGVRELVTERQQHLIASRLRQMAPLLRELYKEDEVWQWAIVAADTLSERSPVRLDEHPFLLGIVACSLENALGEPIGWLDLF